MNLPAFALIRRIGWLRPFPFWGLHGGPESTRNIAYRVRIYGRHGVKP